MGIPGPGTRGTIMNWDWEKEEWIPVPNSEPEITSTGIIAGLGTHVACCFFFLQSLLLLISMVVTDKDLRQRGTNCSELCMTLRNKIPWISYLISLSFILSLNCYEKIESFINCKHFYISKIHIHTSPWTVTYQAPLSMGFCR